MHRSMAAFTQCPRRTTQGRKPPWAIPLATLLMRATPMPAGQHLQPFVPPARTQPSRWHRGVLLPRLLILRLGRRRVGKKVLFGILVVDRQTQPMLLRRSIFYEDIMPRMLKRNTKSPRVYVTLRDPETRTNRCFTIADATIDQVEQMIDSAVQDATNPPEEVGGAPGAVGSCNQPGNPGTPGQPATIIDSATGDGAHFPPSPRNPRKHNTVASPAKSPRPRNSRKTPGKKPAHQSA